MHIPLSLALSTPIASVLTFAATLSSTSQPGPVVDLGYSLHRATVNESAGYFNFSNIRYGRAPTGQLRFRVPQPPLTNRSAVDHGQTGRICAQAVDSGKGQQKQFLVNYFRGGNTSQAASSQSSTSNQTSPVSPDPRISEDCLFLDVIVPTNVFPASLPRTGSGAPVLLWIHGGATSKGSKNQIPSAAGLISRSKSSDPDGLIFVSINYRLGALGFLAGPTFQQNGTANCGLYDQRLALEWVQQYIHLFGGDPKRVTVAGSSAGGSSVLHQVTAFGGERDAPFQQIFTESGGTGELNAVSNAAQEQRFNTFLNLSKASSLSELRSLPFSALAAANQALRDQGSGSIPSSGIAIDGDFVRSLPEVLLSRGQYSKNNISRVMVGWNTNDGLTFAPPAGVQNVSAQNMLFQRVFSEASPNFLNQLEKLYPPVFNRPSLGYHDLVTRFGAVASDFGFICGQYSLLKAFGFDRSYAYEFNAGYALHGEQVPYTFYNNGSAKRLNYGEGMINGSVAGTFQSYIAAFVTAGSPVAPSMPALPPYGGSGTVLQVENTTVGLGVNPASAERCDFWEKALWF